MESFKIIIIIPFSIIILILFFRYLKTGNLYFTSSFSLVKEFNLDEQGLKQNVEFALKKTNFKNIKNNVNHYSALTLPSLFSFSERIRVEIKEVKENTYIIKFESECLFPLQIFDWSKNECNSNKFFSNLNALVIK